MKRQRQNRDHYLLSFKDEKGKSTWKTGNLLRFLMSLYEANSHLRDAWTVGSWKKFKTSRDYGKFIWGRIATNLRKAYVTEGSNTAKFSVYPTGHANYERDTITITRVYPTHIKGLQP